VKRSEVLEALAAHRDELRSRFAVKSLALFGSVARDEGTDASDVDLMVEFDRPVGLFHLIDTEDFIRGLLGVEKVDLVLRRAVLPELKAEILAEAVDVL
jgi:predicted nucleotidyltransferase